MRVSRPREDFFGSGTERVAWVRRNCAGGGAVDTINIALVAACTRRHACARSLARGALPRVFRARVCVVLVLGLAAFATRCVIFGSVNVSMLVVCTCIHIFTGMYIFMYAYIYVCICKSSYIVSPAQVVSKAPIYPARCVGFQN